MLTKSERILSILTKMIDSHIINDFPYTSNYIRSAIDESTTMRYVALENSEKLRKIDNTMRGL